MHDPVSNGTKHKYPNIFAKALERERDGFSLSQTRKIDGYEEQE
jgi:hypothetical protein